MSLDQSDASPTVYAQLFSAEQMWHHIRVECTGVVDDIVETLSPEGPYAYTINPVPTSEGSVPNQEIAYTREGIRKAYTELHEISMVTGLRATTEIRSDWYSFVCGIGDGQELATGQMHHTPVAIIFPEPRRSGDLRRADLAAVAASPVGGWQRRSFGGCHRGLRPA